MKIKSMKQKLIWSVDPFAKDQSLQRTTAQAIRALAKNGNYEIEPVYVVNSVTFDFPIKFQKDLLAQMSNSAQVELDDLLEKIELPELKPIRLISDLGSSIQRSADAVLEYAHNSGASLIVLSTRAKKGPSRWVMGSFAETLSLASDIPLLIVNPFEKRAPSFKHILFPTDFSAESEVAFREMLPFAKVQKSKVTLFHKLPSDWILGFGADFTVVPDYQEIYESDRQWRDECAEEWKKIAKTYGVSVSIVMDTKLGGSAAASILKQSVKRGGIIAMSAQSGRFAASLMGSTTRQVIRNSKLPVWVIHGPTKKKNTVRTKHPKQKTREAALHDWTEVDEHKRAPSVISDRS